jgi:hypothetical protein
LLCYLLKTFCIRFLLPFFWFYVGTASAGGMIAVVLANIVAVFLVRSIAKNVAD